MQIFIELGYVYRSDKVNNETVLTDTESIKGGAYSDQTVEAVTSKVNVRKMIESDGSYTILHAGKAITTSISQMHFRSKYEIFLSDGYCIPRWPRTDTR